MSTAFNSKVLSRIMEEDGYLLDSRNHNL
jgi:hypothetical protein